MSQTNTQSGPITLPASVPIPAGRLVSIGNDSGKAVAALPVIATAEVPFVSEDTAEAGKNVPLRPLCPSQNVRVTLAGTCVPGDLLVLTTPDGTNNGMVTKLRNEEGTYRLIGIAEETGANAQAVRLRPVGQRLVTVTITNP